MTCVISQLRKHIEADLPSSNKLNIRTFRNRNGPTSVAWFVPNEEEIVPPDDIMGPGSAVVLMVIIVYKTSNQAPTRLISF